MKKTKLVIALGFLFVLCVSVVWAECNLAMRFPILFSIVSASALLTVLVGLLRAPAGYEDENGFHIRARQRQVRARQALAISVSHS